MSARRYRALERVKAESTPEAHASVRRAVDRDKGPADGQREAIIAVLDA